MKDLMGQKTILILEPKPIVSLDLDKGKGLLQLVSKKKGISCLMRPYEVV